MRAAGPKNTCRSPIIISLLALALPPTHPTPKTSYEAFWRNLPKGQRDLQSAFEEHFDKTVDGITPIQPPKGIDWQKLLPIRRSTLSEADREQCGRDYVRRAGGLRNILGDRLLMRDVDADGEAIRLPRHNLTLIELMKPLGSRTISEQYKYDRERPNWDGVLGHVLHQARLVGVAGPLGERILSRDDHSLEGACELELLKTRTLESATPPEIPSAWGSQPKTISEMTTENRLIPAFVIPTLEQLQHMQNLMKV